MHLRGPDGKGHWDDLPNRILLGHSRLSVIDLSDAGRQPMESSNGRYVITFNGEIYNARELKGTLGNSGIKFKGHSDTEVLLEACAYWGLGKTISFLNGMFAFALWDKETESLYLVRDRLGIKPLYWGDANGHFIFASELKALRKYHNWDFEIDRRSLASYMRHGYIPAPHSIYKNIYKLKPGHILKLAKGQVPEIDCYWDAKDIALEGLSLQQNMTETEAISELENLLIDSVSSQMLSDVPLGAFLSGGIDSSTVVALMQAYSSKPIKTFSIGFSETSFNEAQHAKQIANYLGTEHTELYLTPPDALNTIPCLAQYWDEPFADSSQIPTYLLSKMTREHVTVSLSGDGGDELFAGYNRYLFANNLMSKIQLTPDFILAFLSKSSMLLSPESWTKISQVIPKIKNIPNAGDKLYKLVDLFSSDEAEMYLNLISLWKSPNELVLNASEHESILLDKDCLKGIHSQISKMQLLDTITYLPDDILTKVDRASMAVSLEARVPLLDHRLVEFSWRLPMHMKVRNGQGKWILRQILNKHVPSELIDRPKMGFGVPIGEWLRGPLREWAEELLDEAKIKHQGYLNYEPIKKKWNEHLSGNRNWQYQLWNVLMFQAWHERWMSS